MKTFKLPLTLICVFFVLVNTSAQNLILEYSADSPNKIGRGTIERKYDEKDRMIERVFYEFRGSDLYEALKKEEFAYENDKLTCMNQFRRRTEEDAWELRVKALREYDDQGCLLKTQHNRYSNSNGSIVLEESGVLNYKNLYDCDIPWKSSPDFLFQFDTTLTIERVREDTIEFEFIYLNPNITYIQERRYNKKEQLVYAYRKWYNFFNRGAKHTYEYDERGKVIKELFYTEVQLGEFELIYDFTYEYVYQDDLVLEKKTMLIDYDYGVTGTFHTIYDYFCDGLLRSESLVRSEGRLETKIFEYDQGADCEIEETAIEFKVYPNPYEDFITIESNLLQIEDVIVNVYRMDGRLIYRNEIEWSERVTSLIIDLPPTGDEFLVVNIVANGKSYSKKVVRVR